MTMEVKKGNTYYQNRKHLRLDPNLLEVLKVIDPDCNGFEICEVRWHILVKKQGRCVCSIKYLH